MKIIKYNRAKQAQVIDENTYSLINQYLGEQVTITSQKVAMQTTEMITTTATIDASGNLIMTTKDVAQPGVIE